MTENKAVVAKLACRISLESQSTGMSPGSIDCGLEVLV